MHVFDQQLLRLKQVLQISEDQAVAEALGMSKAAFSDRKRRNAFPADKLYALAAKRPDLKLDVEYVLSGRSGAEMAASMLTNFGPRLREVRGKRTPAKFAKLLGVSVGDLALMERGERRPTPDEALRLQETHPQHSVIWLWGGEAPTLNGELDQLEVILIRNYRAATPEGQDLLRRQAAMLATGAR
jgi:transcriptional regulator with XRE-family HTH domain